MSELRVYVHHLVQMNICNKGARKFAAKRNLDWNLFLTAGILVSELEALNDHHANMVIAFVRKQNGQ